MIIMQTLDAAKQKQHILSSNLGSVIFEHEHDDALCVQYHPKGIKGRLKALHGEHKMLMELQGGVIPELDSHSPIPSNPTPLASRFSPWHACGTDYVKYSAGMKRTSHLQLVGVTLALAPGDSDVGAATKQWEDMFGIPRSGNELYFANARVTFLPGSEGQVEGLTSITIAVQGRDRMAQILESARKEGLCGDLWIEMLGARWYFVQAEDVVAKL